MSNINSCSKKIISFDYVSGLVEVTRIVVSSFLITPKICDKQICNLTEIITTYKDTDYAIYVLGFNLSTLLVYIVLYITEIRREMILIEYLRNDNSRFTTNQNVAILFRLLPDDIRKKILRTNKFYQKIVIMSIIFYIMNTLANSYILYIFCDIPTLLILMTNIFFMGGKLGNSYEITQTETYIFYSANLNKKYQFNDINPYVMEIIKKDFNDARDSL